MRGMDLKYAEIFAILCGVLLLAWAAAEQNLHSAAPVTEFLQEKIAALEGDLKNARADLKNAQFKLTHSESREMEMRKKLEDMQIPVPGPPPQKPQDDSLIFTLSENEKDFRFSTGSAEIRAAFQEGLITRVFSKIREKSEAYGCDVLMIIGHTDESQFPAARASNLDDSLTAVNATGNLDQLAPGSNTDLGMVRALAVAIFMRQHADQYPEVKYFLPYSAGQLIMPDRSLSSSLLGPNLPGIPDDSRRRIELQLTKSSFWKAETPHP